jgi:uncharacterized lipoprotein YajG
MIRIVSRAALSILLLGLAFGPAYAKDTGIFTITLRYTPQESVGSDSPTLLPGISEHPIRVSIEDARTVQDLAVIGELTDSDDRPWPVRAANSLTAWATEVLTKNAGDWGVRVSDSAPLTLVGKITRFRVKETKKFMSSTYNADVQVAFTMKDAHGRTLWEGTAPGDATRFGHSRSEENINEVLSDALKEAYATGLAETGLQNAWLGKAGPVASSPGTAAPAKPAETITPEDLVNELVKLKKQSFGNDILIDFIQSKTLTRALKADDLAKLKSAGIPDEVIKAAIDHSKV